MQSSTTPLLLLCVIVMELNWWNWLSLFWILTWGFSCNIILALYQSDGRSRNSTLIQFSVLELHSIAMIYITVRSPPPRETWPWWLPHPWSGMLLDTGHGVCVCINILIKVPFICFIIHGCEKKLTHYKAVDLITSTYFASESLFGYMGKKNSFHSGYKDYNLRLWLERESMNVYLQLVWENSA